MQRLLPPLLACLCLSISAPVVAVPLTFTFQTGIDAASVGGGVADTLTMQMVVDSEAANIGFSSEGRYAGTMTLSIGNETATGTGHVIVENDRTDLGYDRIGFFANSFTGFYDQLFGQSLLVAGFNFYDSSFTAFADNSLPSAIDLGSFDAVDGGLNLGGQALFPLPQQTPIERADFVFEGPVSVPEPASLGLMLIGIVPAFAKRKTRR